MSRDEVRVGQVRRARYTGRHYVVMWVEGDRVLVGANSGPENDHSWDHVDTIKAWTLIRDQRGNR